ncbi:hypothetical protein [Nocardioides lentus]
MDFVMSNDAAARDAAGELERGGRSATLRTGEGPDGADLLSVETGPDDAREVEMIVMNLDPDARPLDA